MKEERGKKVLVNEFPKELKKKSLTKQSSYVLCTHTALNEKMQSLGFLKLEKSLKTKAQLKKMELKELEAKIAC